MKNFKLLLAALLCSLVTATTISARSPMAESSTWTVVHGAEAEHILAEGIVLASVDRSGGALFNLVMLVSYQGKVWDCSYNRYSSPQDRHIFCGMFTPE